MECALIGCASPKKRRVTRSLPCIFEPSAAPAATGRPEPTMLVSPRLPTLKSDKCIEPPMPELMPVALPISSANSRSTRAPLLIGCPCEPWLPTM